MAEHDRRDDEVFNDETFNSEHERQYGECTENYGTRWTELSAPGTHGFHEALHMTDVVLQMFEEHVMNHPAVVQDKQTFAKAWEISELIASLYGALGSKSV